MDETLDSERGAQTGAGAHDGHQGRTGEGQAIADADQAPKHGRRARRRCHVHVRRPAHGMGGARERGAAERAHLRPAQRHPVLHGGGRGDSVDDKALAGAGQGDGDGSRPRPRGVRRQVLAHRRRDRPTRSNGRGRSSADQAARALVVRRGVVIPMRHCRQTARSQRKRGGGQGGRARGHLRELGAAGSALSTEHASAHARARAERRETRAR
eukprot:1194309-Pleurochrysis_carterae.AAC.2